VSRLELMNASAPEQVLEYFDHRSYVNSQEVETTENIEDRKQALIDNLRLLGNAAWRINGTSQKQLDIFTARADVHLAPLPQDGQHKINTVRDGEIVNSRIGRCRFLWSIATYAGETGPKTIFMDSEDQQIGVYDHSFEPRTFNFPEQQEETITAVENKLATIFYKGSPVKSQPADLHGRYEVLPLHPLQINAA
jgi:hypothetical protein